MTRAEDLPSNGGLKTCREGKASEKVSHVASLSVARQSSLSSFKLTIHAVPQRNRHDLFLLLVPHRCQDDEGGLDGALEDSEKSSKNHQASKVVGRS